MFRELALEMLAFAKAKGLQASDSVNVWGSELLRVVNDSNSDSLVVVTTYSTALNFFRLAQVEYPDDTAEATGE